MPLFNLIRPVMPHLLSSLVSLVSLGLYGCSFPTAPYETCDHDASVSSDDAASGDTGQTVGNTPPPKPLEDIVCFQKEFTETGNERLNYNTIAASPDGGYVGGGQSGEIIKAWVFKINASGEKEWEKLFGEDKTNERGSDPASKIHSLVASPDGGYLALGSLFSADMEEYDSASNNNYTLLKLDESGETEWTRVYEVMRGADSRSIALRNIFISSGGYLITGSFEGEAGVLKINESGDEQWRKTFSEIGYLRSLFSLPEGGYVGVGSTSLPREGDMDPPSVASMVKVKASGGVEWARDYGGSSESFSSVTSSHEGGYIVAGPTFPNNEGRSNAIILNLNDSGEILWEKIFGGDEYSLANYVVPSFDGGYVAAGTIGRSEDKKIFVFKINGSGELQWEKKFANENDSYLRSFIASPDGGFVAGYVFSYPDTADPEGFREKTGGGILKLDAAGELCK